MIAVIVVELAIAILVGLTFVVLYAIRSPWTKTTMGRHAMALAIVGAGEAASLFALALGVDVPLWVFAVGFAALDAVLVQRLWIFFRAQKLID